MQQFDPSIVSLLILLTIKNKSCNTEIHKCVISRVCSHTYPNSVLGFWTTAVFCKNIGAISWEVVVDAIKCFKMILSPRFANPISVLTSVRYWKEHTEFTTSMVIKN